jgi:hypothetical protein
MLHISYQYMNRFLICKDTLKIYNSLYFWRNKKHQMVIPIYKTPSLKNYQAILRANIKRDILFTTHKYHIFVVNYDNSDFLRWLPYICCDIFVSKTEMSLYTFTFYIHMTQKMVKYVANNHQYNIKSDPYFLSFHDFYIMFTKLCYYQPNIT